jgi:hypothetical protein
VPVIVIGDSSDATRLGLRTIAIARTTNGGPRVQRHELNHAATACFRFLIDADGKISHVCRRVKPVERDEQILAALVA